jgi:bifunctional DNA-binding transcriptional regulator/antitoxin component of YhaV-PrlF toxin-antitoxin module
MNPQGRLTVPAEARRELQLEGAVSFDVEVVEGRLVLTPTPMSPPEDAWAYTPEHRALVARARQDVAEGRVYRLGRSDLERMIAEAEDDPTVHEQG